MASISISVSSPHGSATANGTTTDPAILAAARTILDALTNAAESAEATA